MHIGLGRIFGAASHNRDQLSQAMLGDMYSTVTEVGMDYLAKRQAAGTLKLDGIIIETCAGKGRDRVPRGVHDISAARP